MSRWKPKKTRSLYSTHQVAELLEVHPSSVIKWINEGRMRSHKTPGGHRRIRDKELLQFLHAHEMAVPPELLGAVTRVSWIDDDQAYLKDVRREVQKSGAKLNIDFHADELDGLIAVGIHKPNAVVLDLFTYTVDAFEIIRRLKAGEATKSATVMVVTRNPESGDREEAHEAGADHFFSKSAEEIPKVLEALSSAR